MTDTDVDLGAAPEPPAPTPPPGEAPSVDDLLGEAPKGPPKDINPPIAGAPKKAAAPDEPPSVDDILRSATPDNKAPWWALVNDDYLKRHTAGSTLRIFQQGWNDNIGPDPLTLSPETDKDLRDLKVFSDVEHKQQTLFQAFNEFVIPRAALVANAILRGGMALYHGVGDVLVNEGVSRDIVGIPESKAGDAEAMPQPKAAGPKPVYSTGSLHEGDVGPTGMGTVIEPHAVTEMPVISEREFAATSEEARLKAADAELAARQGEVTPESEARAQDAAEKLARLEVVDRDLAAENLTADERHALSQRRDEILADTTPEKLKTEAEQVAIASRRSAIADRLDEIAQGRRDAIEQSANLILTKVQELVKDEDISPGFKPDETIPPFIRPLAAASGADPVARSETPLIDKAGNIRLDNMNQPEDVKQVFRDMEAAHPFDQTPMTDTQRAQAAEALGLTPENFVPEKNGSVQSSVYAEGIKNLAQRSAVAVRDAYAAAKEGDEASLLAVKEAEARHQMIQEEFARVTQEGGRTLNALKREKAVKVADDTLNAFLQRAKTGDTAEDILARAKAGAALDTPAKVGKLLMDARKPTFKNMFLYYWENNLISGMFTHTAYAGANLAFAAFSIPGTFVAGGIGALRDVIPGAAARTAAEAERVMMGEAGARAWGMLKGAPKGLVAGWEAFLSNAPGMLPGEVVKPKGYMTAPPIPGIAGNIIGSPGRTINAVHSIFRSVAYEMEKEALAWRGAAKGQTGYAPFAELSHEQLASAIDDLSQRIKANDPTDPAEKLTQPLSEMLREQTARTQTSPETPDFWARRQQLLDSPTPEMMAKAIQNANYQVFVQDLGQTGRMMQQLANRTFIGKTIFPFMRTPLDIFKAANEYLPTAPVFDGGVRANLRGENGPVARDTQIARYVVGAALGTTVVNYALQDMVTGGGPTDPELRRTWLLTHQPYSWRVGDWWYGYHRYAPLGQVVGAYADAAEIARQVYKAGTAATDKGGTVFDGDYNAAVSATVKAAGKFVFDETFMRGASSVIKAVEDPDHHGAKYVDDYLASLIPFSTGMGQIASTMDPDMREARGLLDTLKNKIPGQRETLMPKLDPWGEVVPNPRQGMGGFVEMKKTSDDPVNVALNKLGIGLAGVPREIRGVPLTDEQYFEYGRVAGRLSKMQLDQMVNTNWWDNTAPATQYELMNKAIKAARSAAEKYVLMEPGMLKDALQARYDRLTGAKAAAKSVAP